MKLTGKALDAFAIKYGTIEYLPESCQNALIIEFFDSVGIWNKVFFLEYENGLGNYKENCIKAIEKANEIFNLNNK